MLKDINPPRVEGMAMAIVNEAESSGGEDWMVYFINTLEEGIEGVLIRSNGYGVREGQEIKTSELRHFRDQMPGSSYFPVEPIMPDMFDLSNEYHVSYYLNNQLHDKKYVFVPGSIAEEYVVDLPIVGKRGVLIK